MAIKPDVVYRVTKGNTDGSVLPGDLVYIDSKTGQLVCNGGDGGQGGWLGLEELVADIMDFEAEEAKDFTVARSGGRVWIEKKEQEVQEKADRAARTIQLLKNVPMEDYAE